MRLLCASPSSWRAAVLAALVACSGTTPSKDTPNTPDTSASTTDTDTAGTTDTASPPTAEPGTALYHAQQCAAHLGVFPVLDCNTATVIPVTVDGVEVSEDAARCDRPAALGLACDVGNRVARAYGTDRNGAPRPEVVYVSLCREEEGVGVIGHNTETGATCFYSTLESAWEGIPTPNDPEAFEAFWDPPQDVVNAGCVNCHQADPFLHSPWIDQIADPDDPSVPLVPLLGDPDAPYFIIGDGAAQPLTTELPDNACVSCHRPQCSPGDLNYELDRLEMPAPFAEIRFSQDMQADRDAVRQWCAEVGLRNPRRGLTAGFHGRATAR